MSLAEKLQQIATELGQAISNEINSSQAERYSRLVKGKALHEAETLATTADDDSFLDGLTPRQWAVEFVIDQLKSMGHTDPRLSRTEAARVIKAYRDVVLPLGGIDAQFINKWAIDPQTKQPLVDDAGNPFMQPITSVRLNSLHDYAGIIEPSNADDVLSFLREATDRVTQEAKQLLTEQKPQAEHHISVLLTGTMEVEQGDDVIEVPMDDKARIAYIREQLGRDPKPEYKQFPKMEMQTYMDYFYPVILAYSFIASVTGRQFNTNEEGLVDPTHVLIKMLDIYDVKNAGPWLIVQALVQNNELSEAELAGFTTAWEQGGIRERFEDLTGIAVEPIERE